VAGVGVLLALAGASLLAMPSVLFSPFRSRSHVGRYLTSPVRRTDLTFKMTTGGRVESSEKTVIECRIENVDMRIRGQGVSLGGATTILSVIPDGSQVKKGDVLCVLDSSAYEELVRVQQINVERTRADFRQAELNLEVARMAVDEYRDGLMQQTLKTLNGQIVLTDSDRERAADRLEWSRRMLDKGYLSRGQVTTEEFTLNRLVVTLQQNRTALRMFEKFSAPKYIRILRSDVLSAEAFHSFQLRRLQRSEERLDYYKRLVGYCTIRAPHDGFLIYHNEEMKAIQIEPGLVVRQRQKLFYLPDLAQMEVDAMLHESVVKDARPGMRALVRIEGLPDRLLEGHLESVTQVPTQQNVFSDVKYFIGIVKLDAVPKGLKPGMTAEVELVTARKADVLVIPADALTVEQGHDVCYVAHGDEIERREIKLGQATRDLLEVTAGLDEGEEVVLDPSEAASPVVVADLPAPTVQTESAGSEPSGAAD
jgi:HlyD family secretion protein